MGYYSAIKIKDTSGIKIPASFIEQFNVKNERLDYLSSLSEDIMTVKESKELEQIKKDEKNFEVELSPSFFIKRDNGSDDSYKEEGKYYIFWDGENILYIYLEEGEYFSFKRDGDYFIGDGEVYVSSNYGWAEEMIIELIQDTNSSAIIEDMGDEEYGFVYEDGCDRELSSPKVYINGERQ